MTSPLKNKSVLSWAAYDWANSAFATTVMAALIPNMYGSFWASDLSKASTTRQLLLTGTVASLLVAIIGPVFGAFADKGGRKKLLLGIFAGMGILSCFLFATFDSTMGRAALATYFLGLLAFSSANVFYDSLIVDVSPRDKFDFVSAFGYGMGYLGGGVLFAINLLMISSPSTFGFETKGDAIPWVFMSVGVWWLLFSLPLFLVVKERKPSKPVGFTEAAKSGWIQLLQTIKEIRKYPIIVGFLLSYIFYIDGVNSIMRIAIKFGTDMNLDQATLMKALLLVQIIGFPMAIIFGKLGEKFGARHGILLAIGIYILANIGTYFVNQVWHLYAFAAAIGCAQGGIQSLSRSYYAAIIPEDKAGEFFGFYNLLGKFSAVLGPVLISATTLILGWLSVAPDKIDRITMLPLLLLFIIGAILLIRLPKAKEVRTA